MDNQSCGKVASMGLPEHITAAVWVDQVFTSAEALKGGVVKRQIRDVDRIAGRAYFLEEATRRGFQVAENGRHFVVFCNPLPVRFLTRKGFEKPFKAAFNAALRRN